MTSRHVFPLSSSTDGEGEWLVLEGEWQESGSAYLAGDFGAVLERSGSLHTVKCFHLIVVREPPEVLESFGH